MNRSSHDTRADSSRRAGRGPTGSPRRPGRGPTGSPRRPGRGPTDSPRRPEQSPTDSPRRPERAPTGSPLLSMLFFPAAILYQELLLRLFDRDVGFFDVTLLRLVFFSLAAGLCLFLILDLLPWRRTARITGGVVLGAGAVLFCIERGCRAKFGLYYGLGFMGSMVGDVTGDFGGDVLQVALNLIPFILLSLVPLAAYIPLRQTVLREKGQKPAARFILASGLVLFQFLGWALSAFGGVSSYYTYEYTANVSIPHFGLFTTVRLELEYNLLGQPAPPSFIDDPVWTPPPATTDGSSPTGDPSADPSGGPTDGPVTTPIPSGPNVLDIDFTALAGAETNETLKGMHQYFATLIPSEKNEYTGIFEGKNLILLTAEAFSPYAIDRELTPTLYRLTHEEGFVFNNFYQPDWTMSTTGGEFSVTTGLIPVWCEHLTTSEYSINKAMPLTLAHLFAAEGYSVPAWHNHTYDYYKRDQYLTNFGYDYTGGRGGGLEIPSGYTWPESDLEMMEATVDSYIDGYVNNGTPFHAYYMTVSGHGGYTWKSNAMSRKHREVVEAKYPNLSEPCQAYIACNMELDLALEYLVDKLEAAGIADDTLIVMAADHYPYLMVDDQPEDYYNELRGLEDTEKDTSRFRNTLLMWSGRFREPIVVDTPCYTPDIVPTICNLFGLEYDSRLYSGRDIFAANYEANQYSNCMPLVVFANNKGQGNSWITAAGAYEASTKTFTPNEGVVLGDQDDYVARVKRLVSAKLTYSRLILEQDYYKVLFPDGTV